MRGGCYLQQKTLGRWAGGGEVTVVAATADSGCCQWLLLLLPAAFCFLCPSPVFILFSAVFGLAVVEGGRGSGWEEKWRWFQAVARLSFLLLLCAEPAVSVFSSLSVLSCFSYPSLVLLALAALMVAGWWGWWWWLGGTMEALVEVQRWLFSSLFCLALSLSSVSQKTIPRLVSLSLLFLFSSSSFSSPFLPRFCSLLPSALQKISPPSSCLPLSIRLPFSLSPKFCPPWLLVPPLVFISRGGEDHLTTAMAQGKVGDGSCWQGMVSVSFFFHNACRVWLCGYGSCGIFGQVGGW